MLVFCFFPKRSGNILQPKPALQGCFFFFLSWYHVTVIIMADVMLLGLGERGKRKKKKPVHTPSRPVVAESECSELQSHTSCSMFLRHFRQEASGLDQILAIASHHPTLRDFRMAGQPLSDESWSTGRSRFKTRDEKVIFFLNEDKSNTTAVL